mmetsp:Transcript_31786/g.101028  ORF Transcript_31786/g.101028 Transcript_31786/m.101028 type:complete len:764 (+) Transcript_31786:556-2847(+)
MTMHGKKRFSVDDALRLCAGAVNDGPVACATSSYAKGMRQSAVSKLCARALNEAPAFCYKEAPSGLNADAKVDLCASLQAPRFGDELAEGEERYTPAVCMRDFPPAPRLKPAEKARRCRLATEATRPCVYNASLASFGTALSGDQVAQLCAADVDGASLRCAGKVHHQLRMHSGGDGVDEASAVLAACLGADEAVDACVRAVRQDSWSIDDKLRLCARARGTRPAVCVSELARDVHDDELLQFLCAGATAEYTDCLKMAPQELSWKERRSLCSGGDGVIPIECYEEGRRNGLAANTTMALCAGAWSVSAPIKCAVGVKAHKVGKNEVVALCRGTPDETGILACLAEAKNVPTKARICAGARDAGPGVCAADLHYKFRNTYGVMLCKGAADALPSHCASFQQISFKGFYMSAKMIQKCREEPERIAKFMPAKLLHDGEAVYTGQPFGTQIWAYNQYNVRIEGSRSAAGMRGDDSVVAFMSPKDDVKLGGTKRIPFREGEAFFKDLTLDKAGTWEVRFEQRGPSGEDVEQPAKTTIFVQVRPTRYETLVELCAPRLFTFQCLQEPYDGSDHLGLTMSRWDARIAAMYLPCIEFFEDEGVTVVTVPGGDMYFLYHEELLRLFATGLYSSGAGAFHYFTEPWKVLGVEPDATRSELRKVYHELSLVWHPDRWAHGTLYQDRAGRVFSGISDAYGAMLERLDDRGDKGREGGKGKRNPNPHPHPTPPKPKPNPKARTRRRRRPPGPPPPRREVCRNRRRILIIKAKTL